MANETIYFSVGLHKGEVDFGVSGAVASLTYEEMKAIREMLVVGIGVMEGMWRNGHSPSPAHQEKP